MNKCMKCMTEEEKGKVAYFDITRNSSNRVPLRKLKLKKKQNSSLGLESPSSFARRLYKNFKK